MLLAVQLHMGKTGVQRQLQQYGVIIFDNRADTIVAYVTGVN